MYREGNVKIFVNGTTIVPYTETKGERSGFEETFTALCKENGISVMHEPLKFRLSDKSMYVPDFLLFPAAYGSGQHGPFIEVKGLWTVEGKRKFLMFTKEYPEFPIFLVDEKMLSILKKGHYETK